LWAVVLILGGVLLLAQNFLIQEQFHASVWTVILCGLGLLFLLDAITTRGQDWWALIPGCILLGVAATIWLAELPDRAVRGEVIGSVMLFSIGLPFLLIFLIKRGAFWWALIPGGIMTVLAAIPILSLSVRGEAIGSFVMWAIGLAFVVVYLANRRQWWALIPGGIMLVVGVIPLLTLVTRSEVIGAFVLWVIAAPFLIVYLINRKHWWALIPSGTLFVIGLMPLLATTQLQGQFIAGVFFVGLAGLFGLLYLVNLGKPDMFWPVYPAAVLFAVGIGVMAFGQYWWPLILIALGVVLLLRSILPRRV
jgi:hypothetical protein